MIATLDRLYAIEKKLEIDFDVFDKLHGYPFFFDYNDVLIMKRIVREVREEAEEVLYEFDKGEGGKPEPI